jgi:hypothetical protein
VHARQFATRNTGAQHHRTHKHERIAGASAALRGHEQWHQHFPMPIFYDYTLGQLVRTCNTQQLLHIDPTAVSKQRLVRTAAHWRASMLQSAILRMCLPHLSELMRGRERPVPQAVHTNTTTDSTDTSVASVAMHAVPQEPSSRDSKDVTNQNHVRLQIRRTKETRTKSKSRIHSHPTLRVWSIHWVAHTDCLAACTLANVCTAL